MAVARNSLGTKYYSLFYTGIQSKAYPVANVQQEEHIFKSVLVLLLVSKNTSAFK